MSDVKSWSTFQIKSINEDARTLTGIASTPSTDRDGDIVDPKGARFKLPLPLLSQHNHDYPIGQVTEAKTTADGIEITASIPDDSGLHYVDRAWKQLKAKLLGGLSIGFRGIKTEPIEGSYGVHFKEWEWFELSVVTIPANAECTIQTVKKFDAPIEDQLVITDMEKADARKQVAAALVKINLSIN